MTLQDRYIQQGATLAPDGIPLHFGDQAREYQAALHDVVLLDRSHEGRLHISGADRFDFLNRMSTNDLLNMPIGAGRATIFTNAHGRVLDRVEVYNQGDMLLSIAEPGRGAALQQYLQRHIFFNDKVRLTDITATTRQFALHGPKADAMLKTLASDIPIDDSLYGITVKIGEVDVYVVRRRPLSGAYWVIVVPVDAAVAVWQALIDSGKTFGLHPSGSLIYNVLRIRAGRPAAGRELTTDYIPLELGLWDEVSFKKGCYTGQEIIARMESRGKLAKTFVSLHLDQAVATPVALLHNGREVGRVTSCTAAPDGNVYAVGVVKVQVVEERLGLTIADDNVAVRLGEPIGVQPFSA